MEKKISKKAFTRLVKHFRSDSSQAKNCHSEARSAEESIMKSDSSLPLRMTGRKVAFTLSETLIALVILGVVASITIPPVVRRQIESSNRTKIKKAMRIYDLVMNKMTIETGSRDMATLKNYAEDNNCEKGSSYFAIAEGSGCVFKTKDGVWWDISDISKVIIALNKNDLNKATAESDTNRAFYLESWFDKNGNLRVDDLAAATGGDKEIISKVYDYISAKTKMSKAEVSKNSLNEKIRLELDNINDYVESGCSSTRKHSCSTMGASCCRIDDTSVCYQTGDFGDGCADGYYGVGAEHSVVIYGSDGNILMNKNQQILIDDKIICDKRDASTQKCSKLYEYDEDGDVSVILSNPVVQDLSDPNSSVYYTSCEGSLCDSWDKVPGNCSYNEEIHDFNCSEYYVPTRVIDYSSIPEYTWWGEI